MHLLSHVIHSLRKPLLLTDDHMNSQSKESYALIKSTFHMNPLLPFLCHPTMISLAMTALSGNNLPGMDVDWNGPTNLPINSHNQFASTFAITRNMELDSEMGLKFSTFMSP